MKEALLPVKFAAGSHLYGSPEGGALSAETENETGKSGARRERGGMRERERERERERKWRDREAKRERRERREWGGGGGGGGGGGEREGRRKR
ncbi:hypothetical protein MTR_7g086070 [Medicago truncatula]|uniref:Uncharacterized protein n=1 Tax=Medicago truncatula TaxID=3880 RepID=G7L0G6_MEDTR|nr:hypothetical protein MTR_7g086070 [Medicago truncatula]